MCNARKYPWATIAQPPGSLLYSSWDQTKPCMHLQLYIYFFVGQGEMFGYATCTYKFKYLKLQFGGLSPFVFYRISKNLKLAQSSNVHVQCAMKDFLFNTCTSLHTLYHIALTHVHVCKL